MREFSVAVAMAAALALAGEARAQGAYEPRGAYGPQGAYPVQGAYPAPGSYGGGFIEALMTGGDPGRVARPLRSAPVAPDGRVIQAPYGYGPAPAAYRQPVYGAVPQGPPTAIYGAVPGLESDPAMVEPLPERLPRAAPYAYRPPAAMAAPPAMAAPRLAEPDGRYRRQEVAYPGPHRPGTIVIDTPARQLYLVQPGGRALRYGIGVGRPGFTWAGMKTVSAKREWPDWTPPAEMLRRRPDLPRHMAGGPENPLGARALYLGSTLYRIHGTNEPNTIGQSVSSGCIRMMNDDVVDLYERVPVGAKVLVI